MSQTNSTADSVSLGSGNLDKNEQILQLKRKLKVLKDAFVKERDAKADLEKQYVNSKSRIDSQENALREKENKIVQLQSENVKLQDSLAQLRGKLENQKGTKSSSNSGSENQMTHSSIGTTIGSSIGEMFGLKKGGQDELKKLQMEYNYLKKQFETVKERLLKCDDEKELMRRELKQEIQSLRTKLALAEEDLSKTTSEAESFEKLYKSLSHAHEELKELFSRHEAELDYTKNKLVQMIKERDHYLASANEKAKLLEERSGLLEHLELQARVLTEKKMNLERSLFEKEEYIADQESRYQVFSVVRKGMTDSSAQILLRKDVEGDSVIDIETVEDRKFLQPYQITSIIPNKENTNVFTLNYRVKPNKEEQETFETKDATKLLKSLKRFMENAREKSKYDQTIKVKGDATKMKEKKFFAEIVSFFGS